MVPLYKLHILGAACSVISGVWYETGVLELLTPESSSVGIQLFVEVSL